MIQSQFKMEPLSLPNRRPTALLISFCLHALLGTALFAATTNLSATPFGVKKRGSPTYIEFAPLTPAPAVRAPSVPRSNGEIPTKKTSPVSPSTKVQTDLPNATQFGVEEGTTEVGDLGEATGFKANDLERYLFELRVILANRKIYPATSKRLGETGRVVVKFNIHRSGKIENLAVQKPSDYSRLNEAALKLVSTVDNYKPFPEGEKVETLAVEVPIDYVLN